MPCKYPDSYGEKLHLLTKLSPWVDAGGWGNITNVSIAYKGDGTGAYQSVYYSPMAHDAVAKLGYA